MNSKNKPVVSGRLKKVVLSLAVGVLLYALTGFFIVPWALKSQLPVKLAELIHRPVTLESVAFNPFSLALTLEKFAVLEKNRAAFASVGRLHANAQLFPLILGKAVLKDLTIEQPAVSVVRDKTGRFNFADLIPVSPKREVPSKSAPENEIPSFLLRNIAISDGKITFADNAAGIGFQMAVVPFSIQVRNLGSRKKTPANYRFHVATRSGTTLSGKGTVSLSDLTSTGQVELKGVAITQFEPYYRQFIKASITSGMAGLGFAYQYPAGGETALPVVSNARVFLKNFVVSGPQGAIPLVDLPEFSITGIALDPEKQTVAAGTLRLAGPRMRIDRSKDGGIYLLDAFMPVVQAPRSPAPPDDQVATKPWLARLEQVEIDDLSFELNDASAQSPSVYSLEKVTARASGIEYDTAKMKGLPLIDRAGVELEQIKITAAGSKKPIVSIPEIKISGIRLDPVANLVTVGTIATRQGALALLRNENGSLNLVESLPATAAADTGGASSDQPAQAARQPLTVRIEKMTVAEYALNLRDLTTPTPAELFLDRIALDAGNLSTAAGEKATVSTGLRWDEGGTLSTRGTLTLSPLAGELKIRAEKIEVPPVQPYLNEKVQVLITGGDLNTTGRVTFRSDPDRGFIAGFKGDTLVANFTALDKHLGKDFLRWKSLHFSGIDVDINPLRVTLDEIALADFYARATINEDGTVNLRTVLESAPSAGEPPTADPETETRPPYADTQTAVETPTPGDKAADTVPSQVPVVIKAVTLQGGTVSFADHLITPHFETEMLELGGSISGLSSAELARADVFLAGRLENHSPLKITGKINPLTRNRYSDISIEFRDIDLSPFSPYSGKYLGYKLEKGMLTLILNYRLSQNTLVAQNKIRFNRLTLGEKVESPDATSLPVKLGLAILSDSEGNVELELPVRGSVNDPEFSLGSIILKAIVGLITKTITAPFAALGAAFAGGAELSYIDFEAGRARVGAEQAKALAALATALSEKPALNLEITGMVDPKADTVELRNTRFNDLLLARQARELYKGGQAPEQAERPAISAEQREAYIARAFKEADIPKPRNTDGTLKKLSAAEMEKLLYTAIAISPADLRQLAMERAEAAKDHLLKDGLIKPKRLYITEPLVDAPRDAAEPSLPRVKFAISN